MSQKLPPIKAITVSPDITLKEVEANDAAAIFNTINSQRTYLGKWLPFVQHTCRQDDTEQFIASIINAPQSAHDLVFVILYKQQFCGLIGFKDTDRTNLKTELGYWLSETYQKKGIVTQAVSSLVNFAFNDMEMNRIQIKCAVGNHASKGIPVRLGFRLEGIERAGELLSNGEFVDLEVYSMLRSEWQSV
jgi:ribosomal-protein-serine acetyltransferase